MTENFYVILYKMSEKFLAALLHIYSLQKMFRKTLVNHVLKASKNKSLKFDHSLSAARRKRVV